MDYPQQLLVPHPPGTPKRVLLMRHPQSTRNAGGDNDDDNTKLTPLGEEQLKTVLKFIDAKKIKNVICSSSERTLDSLLKQLQKTSSIDQLPFHLYSSTHFNEWSRPHEIRKLPRTDARVKEYKESRLRNFGQDYFPEEGGESWYETIGKLDSGFRVMEQIDTDVLLILTHRHRTMQYIAWIKAGSPDPVHLPNNFRMLDATADFDNIDYITLRYGPKYGSGELSWNFKAGESILLS